LVFLFPKGFRKSLCRHDGLWLFWLTPTTQPITATITIITGVIMLAVVIMGTGERREEEGIGTTTRMDDMKIAETIAGRIGRQGLAGRAAVAGS
jgi:hypothetical protein